jgi:hypothetical protein
MERRLPAREFLSYTAVAKSRQLRELLRNATDRELKAICEIVLNLLHGNVTADIDINKRADFLKTFASRKISLNRKREILIISPTYRNIIQKILRSLKL